MPDPLDPLTDADHTLGPDDAPVVLVEYGDYECPSCTATFPHVEQLLATHGGRVRFGFRHFPLTSVHPRAGVAAQAAEAAGAQGRFWDMHALLYRRPGGLETDDLERLALRLGLEIYRFQNDLATERFADKVARQAEAGRRGGVDGTPAFFLNGRRLAPAEAAPEALSALVAEGGRQALG